jgi:DNA-binding SARP family transcriptional activator
MVRNGEPVRLAGPGQRALVAALALERGRIVSVGRLADLLWEGNPPVSARTKIQVHVCALRRMLGQPPRGACGPLLTVGSGYKLCADCVRSDLAEFDDFTMQGRIALEDGDPGTASELFGAALALWRGNGCSDLASPALRAAIRPLEERRVLTVEDKAEADLALGRPAVVIAELPAWLVAMPMRGTPAPGAPHAIACRVPAGTLRTPPRL